jgi:hypothetical protein
MDFSTDIAAIRKGAWNYISRHGKRPTPQNAIAFLSGDRENSS